MKFSLRLLIAVTLLSALLIQAIIGKRQVRSLQNRLALEEFIHRDLDSKASPLRQRTLVCEEVWESYKHPLGGDLTPKMYFDLAEQRFQLMQPKAKE